MKREGKGSDIIVGIPTTSAVSSLYLRIESPESKYLYQSILDILQCRNLFEAFGKSRAPSDGGVAMPVFTGRTEYTVLNGNRYEDGSKSTFLYFVDERESELTVIPLLVILSISDNNEVYEVRGESMRMEVNHRRSITLLSPESQIGMTEVRLAKHGGLKISAGGLREMWHPKYQLIRLTLVFLSNPFSSYPLSTYDTANISSYSIFDPIITIEPTNDENVSYTINNLLCKIRLNHSI